MNDITLDDVNPGQEVFFYLKPHDKQPHMITTIIEAGEDDRGRPCVMLKGVTDKYGHDEVLPLYHVKLLPEDPSLVKMHGQGLPGPHKIEKVKGLDY